MISGRRKSSLNQTPILIKLGGLQRGLAGDVLRCMLNSLNMLSPFEERVCNMARITAKGTKIASMAVLLMTVAWPVMAHTESGAVGGFLSGIAHPISGWDHVVAMIAVGLWGAFLGPPAIWLLPIVFPIVMAIGGMIGIFGIAIPAVEMGIALSAVGLGLCILLALRPTLWVASLIVGAFAIFHGHAHGTELPGSADPIIYATGFVIATGLLHLAGIVLGLLAKWDAGRLAVRAGGGVIALAGVAFLVRLV